MVEVADVVKDKNAMPSFDNARTIEICVLLELAGNTCACVNTDWIAIVKDLPLARSDLNKLFNALSTMTCEHCKCKLLTTKSLGEACPTGWSPAAVITASAGGANVISSERGAISIGHNFLQGMMPNALGVKRTVAYSPGSMAATPVLSPAEVGS